MRAHTAAIRILLTGSLVFSQAWAAESISTDSEGWHTWRIEASGPVSTWCCYSSRGSRRAGAGCNLDAGGISFSNYGHVMGDGDCTSVDGAAQVYAHIQDGEPGKIRVLSSGCPVSADSKLTDHGTVGIEQNIAWFRTVIENPRLDIDVRQEALFALVQTETDAAFEYIDRLLAEK